ncbi:hypothetical protein [Stenotrophomonas rhizophila]|uniref:hypothetical protein n=1 Tax=Stenotrophomonas rhizophila TaxID=216778 RepID=UPI0028A7DAD6|nr:hypothetical protein [Stenotrophomonas rhizophila]
MLRQLYTTYSDPAAARTLVASCEAAVVQWRWATESMAFATPFLQEKQGGPKARWVTDDKADPARHVRHGFDAQGRVVIECGTRGTITAWLHAPGVRHSLSFDDGDIASGWEWREHNGKLQGLDLITDDRGFNETYHWEGDQLQRVVIENWSKRERTWWCQNVYTYNDDGQLDTIVLEYLDAKGRRNGKSRLEYQRPRPGETLATVTAEVERLLIEAVSAQLPRIPAGEPLYCLLLCFTAEDTPAAWPPFLVWGRQPYRQAVLDRGDDEARYYLWAPDEIREVQGGTEEHWFTEPALTEACQRHSQYMELRQSTASATRVLKNVAAWLDAPERRALLTTTDDFVVAVADNSGNIDPLPGLRKAIGPERWAVLKARGCV